MLETKTIPTENGNTAETQDKDVVVEELGSVGVYDQWVNPPVSGQRPKPRYEVFIFLPVFKFIGFYFVLYLILILIFDVAACSSGC